MSNPEDLKRDPFAFDPNAPIDAEAIHPTTGDDGGIRFDLIPPGERELFFKMGMRASALLRDYQQKVNPRMQPPHPMMAAMVLSAAHLAQPMEVLRFAMSDDFTFLSEYIEIEKHLEKRTGRLLGGVKLAFARKQSS